MVFYTVAMLGITDITIYGKTGNTVKYTSKFCLLAYTVCLLYWT